MMDLQIVPAEVSHLEAMAGRWRQADIDELWAAGHHTPEECVKVGIEHSPMAWTAFLDGVPVAVFGVSTPPLLSSTGIPWMVGTVELDRHGSLLLKQGREKVGLMLTQFKRLMNFVDARNTKAIRWLKRLGFKFGEAQPYGAEGLPFYLFTMEA